MEGLSDWFALETIAARRGRKLEDEGIAIVPMGGYTNIGSETMMRTVERGGPPTPDEVSATRARRWLDSPEAVLFLPRRGQC